MKNLKSVLEGILGDIDDTLSKSDKNISKFELFGHRFKLNRTTYISETTAGMLNAQALKHATKSLDYIDDNVERGQFDKRNKFKMFTNWLDHLSFDELEIKPTSDFNSDAVRKKLAETIELKCKSAGFFNNPYYTRVYYPSTRATGNDTLSIMIARTDKQSYCMQLIFDIL